MPLQETLYGDMALADWVAASESDSPPWPAFRRAAAAMVDGATAVAIENLQSVLMVQGLASRHHLQAWAALRVLGRNPPARVSSLVHGVVVDVPIGDGRDTLAVYADGSARYINHAHGAVAWEGGDAAIRELIEGILMAGKELTRGIAAWPEDRPPLEKQRARIAVLTPGGLHLAGGEFGWLARQAAGRPILDRASELVQRLVRHGAAAPTW